MQSGRTSLLGSASLLLLLRATANIKVKFCCVCLFWLCEGIEKRKIAQQESSLSAKENKWRLSIKGNGALSDDSNGKWNMTGASLMSSCSRPWVNFTNWESSLVYSCQQSRRIKTWNLQVWQADVCFEDAIEKKLCLCRCSWMKMTQRTVQELWS